MVPREKGPELWTAISGLLVSSAEYTVPLSPGTTSYKGKQERSTSGSELMSSSPLGFATGMRWSFIPAFVPSPPDKCVSFAY